MRDKGRMVLVLTMSVAGRANAAVTVARTVKIGRRMVVEYCFLVVGRVDVCGSGWCDANSNGIRNRLLYTRLSIRNTPSQDFTVNLHVGGAIHHPSITTTRGERNQFLQCTEDEYSRMGLGGGSFKLQL